MSDSNDALERMNELLEQLLEQERMKTADRQEQMKTLRESMKFELPKFDLNAPFNDPPRDARIDEITRKADERHAEEIAFRNRAVATLEEQTAILNEIARLLRQ